LRSSARDLHGSSPCWSRQSRRSARLPVRPRAGVLGRRSDPAKREDHPISDFARAALVGHAWSLVGHQRFDCDSRENIRADRNAKPARVSQPSNERNHISAYTAMKKWPSVPRRFRDPAIVCRFCGRDLAPITAPPRWHPNRRRSLNLVPICGSASRQLAFARTRLCRAQAPTPP
jgi:hypothetical protein